MKVTSLTRNTNLLLFVGFCLLFGLAFVRVHLRVQSTLIGYQLGTLKSKEAQLLEKRSKLSMTYAKITTREHLELMASSNDSKKPITSLAQSH